MSLRANGINLQQLLIKPATRRVAGRSPAIGFILLFVAGLKANSCKSHEIAGQMFDNEYDLALAIIAGMPSNVLYLKVRK